MKSSNTYFRWDGRQTVNNVNNDVDVGANLRVCPTAQGTDVA